MKRLSAPRLNQEMLQEASEWFVDFRVRDIDATARERFDEWLRRSPEHIRAYWEIAKAYVELPPISSMEKLDIAKLIAYARLDDNVLPLHQARGTRTPPANTRPGSAPYTRRRVLAAACVAVALAAVGATYWQAQRDPLVSTDVGERRSITLADGSTVDLNAHSRLRIEFSSRERRVELLDGQALFQVAKDARRPFIVSSGVAIVRAVGTQFDVYRRDSGTTVTVLEGRVAVYSTARRKSPTDHFDSSPQSGAGTANSAVRSLPKAVSRDSHSGTASGASAVVPALPPGLADPSGTGAVLVSAGEQVTITTTAMPSPHYADTAEATAWIQGRLVFEGSKLSDVVDELNRYNRSSPLVIEDPELRDFEISGVYSSTDPASLLRFLRDQGVKISERGNEVQLGGAASPKE